MLTQEEIYQLADQNGLGCYISDERDFLWYDVDATDFVRAIEKLIESKRAEQTLDGENK
jgi:hypothetical protein